MHSIIAKSRRRFLVRIPVLFVVMALLPSCSSYRPARTLPPRANVRITFPERQPVTVTTRDGRTHVLELSRLHGRVGHAGTTFSSSDSGEVRIVATSPSAMRFHRELVRIPGDTPGMIVEHHDYLVLRTGAIVLGTLAVIGLSVAIGLQGMCTMGC